MIAKQRIPVAIVPLYNDKMFWSILAERSQNAQSFQWPENPPEMHSLTRAPDSSTGGDDARALTA
jgi:hypothetical protein